MQRLMPGRADMKEKKKRPARFLLIIPVMLLVDIAVLAISAYMDMSRTGEPQLPIPVNIPILTIASLYYLVILNVPVLLTSVVLTVLAVIDEHKNKDQQKGEKHENDQHSH
jgi:hypothetical protein